MISQLRQTIGTCRLNGRVRRLGSSGSSRMWFMRRILRISLPWTDHEIKKLNNVLNQTYGGSLGLSPAISSQFSVEMCAASKNC